MNRQMTTRPIVTKHKDFAQLVYEWGPQLVAEPKFLLNLFGCGWWEPCGWECVFSIQSGMEWNLSRHERAVGKHQTVGFWQEDMLRSPCFISAVRGAPCFVLWQVRGPRGPSKSPQTNFIKMLITTMSANSDKSVEKQITIVRGTSFYLHLRLELWGGAACNMRRKHVVRAQNIRLARQHDYSGRTGTPSHSHTSGVRGMLATGSIQNTPLCASSALKERRFSCTH